MRRAVVAPLKRTRGTESWVAGKAGLAQGYQRGGAAEEPALARILAVCMVFGPRRDPPAPAAFLDRPPAGLFPPRPPGPAPPPRRRAGPPPPQSPPTHLAPPHPPPP